MKYKIEVWKIEELLKFYEEGKLNLNPPYQRNDIWPLANKKRLIDSIKSDYPLPMFFLHKKNNIYDMVDGQQRTRTLIGYTKDNFPDMNKVKYSSSDQALFISFELGVTIIYDEDNEKVLQDFYYRVNKFGTKLNRPEILKAQYFDSNIQNLIEDLADHEEFQLLGLFTEISLKRMNDFDFIGELLALQKYGITDKKTYVDKLYSDESINLEEVEKLKNDFLSTLYRIVNLNKIYPIADTRFNQKNDLYTFWSFLTKYPSLDFEIISTQYKVFVIIEKDISPSNENCFALREYATNCVSQSNSKKAREERLKFFEELLLNTEPKPLASENSNAMMDILNFYGLKDDDMVVLGDNFYIPDESKLNGKVKERVIF